MANTKIYTVVKDGETVKELKTLTAAKKLADEQGGEVLCEGETVYTASPIKPQTEEAEPLEEHVEEQAEKPCDKDAELDSCIEEIAEGARKRPVTFELCRKMNVRKEPSLSAVILKVLNRGEKVLVKDIQNDWLYLTDGSYILFERMKNALPM